MAKLTREYADAKRDSVAIVDDHGSVTWAQLDDRVNRLVDVFREAGLQPGETIAIVAGNRKEWFETSLACAHAGLVYVPVNWHWGAEELAYVFGDAAVRAVITDDGHSAQVLKALDDDRSAGVSLVLGAGDCSGGRLASYEDALARASAAEPDVAILGGPMFYTSGTTGHPKGVRGALIGGTEVPSEVLQLVASTFEGFLPKGGCSLLCGPVYHSAQWAFSFLPMVTGSSVVMQHKYDSAGVLDLIDRHGVTNVHLVPTQFKRLLDLPDDVRASFDGSSLAAVWHGAAPCPPEVKRRMIEWWGPVIWEYYGSTEGAIISTISSEDWLARGGSVGKLLPSVEAIVVGEDDQRVGPGEEGTLYFRSLYGTDFEYHNDPDKTASAHLEPGVFTTGDVGYVDSDGYLWLSDRKIDMIISGGVNIYPAEIEGVLAVHPVVADVAVIGVPNDDFGEEVKAVVQLADGSEPSDALSEELVAYCREHLAGYKAPRSVDYIDAIPRTATGKIQKRPLRDPYWEGLDRRI